MPIKELCPLTGLREFDVDGEPGALHWLSTAGRAHGKAMCAHWRVPQCSVRAAL